MQLFRRSNRRAAAAALFDCIVAQSRRPEFYANCSVPDTVDGRFDMIALHAFLVLRRLKGPERDTAQALLEAIFDDMDGSLREMGAGDLGVGRRVKTMAKALYGRIAAYEGALDGPGAALGEALKRNLYGTVDPDPDGGLRGLDAMAAYVRAEAAAIDAQSLESITAGKVSFGPPPGGDAALP